TGWGTSPALSLTMWSGTGFDGTPDTWLSMDGLAKGSAAGSGRDGLDLGANIVGHPTRGAFNDIEILETWYPLMVAERRLRSGANGAGTYRGGQGLQTSFTPYCTDELLGQMLGTRQWLPLEGTAGGRPGATTEFSIISPDGTRRISTETDDVRLRSGETFEFVCASGGGVGDPLDRDPMSVLADLHDGYVSAEEAATV